jgi:hypothetical protein
MTLPQFQELAAYWQKFPPIHLLLSHSVHYKENGNRTNDLSDLMAVFGRGGGFAKS